MDSTVLTIIFVCFLVLVAGGVAFGLMLLTKSQKQIQTSNFEQIRSELEKSKLESKQTLFEFKDKLQQDQVKTSLQFEQKVNQRIESLSQVVETRLEKVSGKVQTDLGEGFKSSQKTFREVIERLAKIDEAQKKIEGLSENVVSLQNVLTDKKTRGIFGEVQLEQLLSAVFGESKGKLYDLQYQFSNQTMADAVLFLPEPMGTLAVDSKFPLENYQKLYDNSDDSQLRSVNRSQAQSLFRKDLKKHIDDIASKYIIPTVTAEQAILFLPAEAIFAEVHARYEDMIFYAQQKGVWIVSPTTLMAVLTTVQSVLRQQEQAKYAHVIQEELRKLSQDFGRYRQRWDNLIRHLDTVQKDAREIQTSTTKITKRFEEISKVEFDAPVGSLNDLKPKSVTDIGHQGA